MFPLCVLVQLLEKMGLTSGDILHGHCWTTLNGPTDSVSVLDCFTSTSLMQSWVEPYTILDRSTQRWSGNTRKQVRYSDWRKIKFNFYTFLINYQYLHFCFVWHIFIQITRVNTVLNNQYNNQALAPFLCSGNSLTSKAAWKSVEEMWLVWDASTWTGCQAESMQCKLELYPAQGCIRNRFEHIVFVCA